MPAGIAAIGGSGGFGRGTLGLDCPNCHHRHDYYDEKQDDGTMTRVVSDCSSGCGCRSEDFIKAKTQETL